MDAADRAVMNPEDVAALVAGSSFAERLDRGAPLIVAAGSPARVEFATPAALALFGVETLGALDAKFGPQAVVDESFGVTDVFVAMPVAEIEPRRLAHFGGEDEAAALAA